MRSSSPRLVQNDWSKSLNGEDYRQRLNDEGRSSLLEWLDNWANPRLEKISEKWKERMQAREGPTQEEEMNLFITILVVTLAWKITNALIVAHDKKVEQRRKEGPKPTQPEWDLPYEVYPGGEEAVRLGAERQRRGVEAFKKAWARDARRLRFW
jgi:hypothetical protein